MGIARCGLALSRHSGQHRLRVKGGGVQQSEGEEARMMRRRRDKRVGPRVKHEHGQMRGSHAADVVPALAGGFLLWGLARREE